MDNDSGSARAKDDQPAGTDAEPRPGENPPPPDLMVVDPEIDVDSVRHSGDDDGDVIRLVPEDSR